MKFPAYKLIYTLSLNPLNFFDLFFNDLIRYRFFLKFRHKYIV